MKKDNPTSNNKASFKKWWKHTEAGLATAEEVWQYFQREFPRERFWKEPIDTETPATIKLFATTKTVTVPSELQRLQELLSERDLFYLARYILTKVELLEKELSWLKCASLDLCTKITSATLSSDTKTKSSPAPVINTGNFPPKSTQEEPISNIAQNNLESLNNE